MNDNKNAKKDQKESNLKSSQLYSSQYKQLIIIKEEISGLVFWKLEQLITGSKVVAKIEV